MRPGRPVLVTTVCLLLVTSGLTVGVGAVAASGDQDTSARAVVENGTSTNGADGLSAVVSRRTPVVGSTVSLRAAGWDGQPVDWRTITAPDESRATLVDHYRASATFRPDRAGNYTVGLLDGNGTVVDTVTLQAHSPATLELLRRYAPRIGVERRTVYRPTRTRCRRCCPTRGTWRP